MPLRYKIDVISELKNAGYSTYKIKKEKIIGDSSMKRIRNGVIVSAEVLELLCRLLKKQPGDILEYIGE